MSTRSNIAIEDEKGKIHAIYVHSDGYPNGVGHCLLENYNSFKKAKELFQFGNASSLGSTLKECSFYERDWGRDEEKARQYNNEWCFLNNMSGDIFIEYVYLFKKNVEMYWQDGVNLIRQLALLKLINGRRSRKQNTVGNSKRATQGPGGRNITIT